MNQEDEEQCDLDDRNEGLASRVYAYLLNTSGPKNTIMLPAT
jgi:hypothetical protein